MQHAIPRGQRILQRTTMLFLLVVVTLCLSACTPTSGIFANGSWQSSGLAHQHIRTLAVDPNNLQALYAGDAQGKVFASTDGGQHWTEHSTGLPGVNVIHALSFDDAGKKLFAATDAGLFVSSDAARSWTALDKPGTGLPADSFTALTFDLSAPHTVYIGTAASGVFMSANGGDSWSPISNGLPADLSINALTFDTTDQQLWAATSLGVYGSNDQGTTWRPYNVGLPTPLVVYSIQPDTIVIGGTKGLIFAGTNHGFFYSQDAGAHWRTSSESLARTDVRFIYVDFHKPSTLYVGTDIGALRSDDNGQSWSGIAPGLPANSPVYALAWGATNYSQLFAAVNDVYQFPGTSGGGFSTAHLVALLLIALFFFVLYRFTRRNRGNRQTPFKPAGPEEPVEKPAENTEVSQ